MCSDLDEHVLEIEFGPDTRAAGDVRHAVAPWLTERSFPVALLGDLLVVVSELVTNAVVHTAAPGRVTVRWDGRRAVVQVDDADPSPPVLLEPVPAIGGRGLLLVDRLSVAWGTDARPDGKSVWAALDAVG